MSVRYFGYVRYYCNCFHNNNNDNNNNTNNINLDSLTKLFLLTTVLTSVTGYFFHSKEIGPPHIVGAISLVLLAVAGWFGCQTLRAQPSGDAITPIRIVEAAGVVELSPPAGNDWIRTQTNQVLRPFYRLRTGANSRAALLWSDHSVAQPFPCVGL